MPRESPETSEVAGTPLMIRRVRGSCYSVGSPLFTRLFLKLRCSKTRSLIICCRLSDVSLGAAVKKIIKVLRHMDQPLEVANDPVHRLQI